MSNESLPEHPQPLADPDVYGTVKAFVSAYAVPLLQPEDVFNGWDEHPGPASAREYAVCRVIRHRRQGAKREEVHAQGHDPEDPGRLTVNNLTCCSMQVEFCAPGDEARRRALALETMACSWVGSRFFEQRGISSLHADEIEEKTFEGDAEKLVRRYVVTLHLTYWTGVGLEWPWFDAVTGERVENVDAHHPPQGD